MILEGNERGNGAELAQHLMNARDNEHVSVHAIDGFVSDDLFGAFTETEAIAAATQCTNYLFSLSLNPPIGAVVTEAEFEAVAARIAKSLGLDGQPFALVFHEKLGRRHAHCVWSRIDATRMKAVPMPHYKRKLMAISHELYIEHGWDVPAGFDDAQKRDPLNFSRQEAGQAKRVKRDPQDLKAMFQRCWQHSDNQTSFAAALWAEGYCLARGNRRGFVAVDSNGEVYSLSRWCGVRTRQLRARLGDPEILPDVNEALEWLAVHKTVPAQVETPTNQASKAALDALIARQRFERDAMTKAHEARQIAEQQVRNARLPRGMRRVWARISGQFAGFVAQLAADRAACDTRDRDERQTLIEKHLAERHAFDQKTQLHDLNAELAQAFSKVAPSDPRQKLLLPPEPAMFTQAQLSANPALILDHISEKKAQFSELDIKRALANHMANPLGLRKAIEGVMQSDELIVLGGDQSPDFTTKSYQRAETELFAASSALASQQTGRVSSNVLHNEILKQNAELQRQFGGSLSDEQVTAIEHVCSSSRLSCVVGLAGAGKSTMLAVAHAAWAKQGRTVHGAALSGKAVDGLQTSSGIASRTLASLELSWKNGYEPIGRDDVLVIDEAGMIGTRQLSRITNKINAIGAKLVLVGDPDQLQPIEAGQPFRYLVERHDAARLTEIHRQKHDWQKVASRDLAAGRLQQAMDAYDQRGAVKQHVNRNETLAALVEDYLTDVETNGSNISRLAFTHRRKDVFALNQAIRGALKSGELIDNQETLVETATGPRAFSVGDRIVFTANEKELGVKNGMLGTVERVRDGKITAKNDEGARVTFDPSRYNQFDHGYAVTIHKAQGATVDQAYVLASKTLDPSLTYVAMTRHRNGLNMYLNHRDGPKWLPDHNQAEQNLDLLRQSKLQTAVAPKVQRYCLHPPINIHN